MQDEIQYGSLWTRVTEPRPLGTGGFRKRAADASVGVPKEGIKRHQDCYKVFKRSQVSDTQPAI